MVNDSDSNEKTFHSLTSLKKRKNKVDSIPFRIDLINEIMDGNKLEKMINFDVNDTEYFSHPQRYFEVDDDESRNTGHVLNKRVLNFNKIINQIGGKLSYKKSGTSGHAFKGSIKLENGEEINYGVKVVAYPKKDKYGNIDNISRPENAELKMIRLLSYFVVKGQTPHIILPIGTFNTSIKPFINLIEEEVVRADDKKYNEFVKKYKKGEYHKNVSILLCEWANHGDFLDFCRKNFRTFKPIYWKIFFFQILSVLAIIHAKFPGFRHNDLKANNILVHETKTKKRSKFVHTINSVEYLVPNIGYQIKLWDFDFACIPKVVDNDKVNTKWTTHINVTPEKNRYYDIHYLFNTFIRKGFFPEFLTEDEIPEEAREFVARIIPRKFRKGKYVHERGRILINKEYLTPDTILKTDPYFEEFRNKSYKKRRKQ
jgi:serine/threonine protein kinase